MRFQLHYTVVAASLRLISMFLVYVIHPCSYPSSGLAPPRTCRSDLPPLDHSRPHGTYNSSHIVLAPYHHHDTLLHAQSTVGLSVQINRRNVNEVRQPQAIHKRLDQRRRS